MSDEKRTPKTRAPAKAAPGRHVGVEAGAAKPGKPATRPRVDVKASVLDLLRAAEKRCQTGGHLDLADLRALRKQVEEL